MTAKLGFLTCKLEILISALRILVRDFLKGTLRKLEKFLSPHHEFSFHLLSIYYVPAFCSKSLIFTSNLLAGVINSTILQVRMRSS